MRYASLRKNFRRERQAATLLMTSYVSLKMLSVALELWQAGGYSDTSQLARAGTGQGSEDASGYVLGSDAAPSTVDGFIGTSAEAH
jgi:hypothetical protein